MYRPEVSRRAQTKKSTQLCVHTLAYLAIKASISARNAASYAAICLISTRKVPRHGLDFRVTASLKSQCNLNTVFSLCMRACVRVCVRARVCLCWGGGVGVGVNVCACTHPVCYLHVRLSAFLTKSSVWCMAFEQWPFKFYSRSFCPCMHTLRGCHACLSLYLLYIKGFFFSFLNNVTGDLHSVSRMPTLVNCEQFFLASLCWPWRQLQAGALVQVLRKCSRCRPQRWFWPHQTDKKFLLRSRDTRAMTKMHMVT